MSRLSEFFTLPTPPGPDIISTHSEHAEHGMMRMVWAGHREVRPTWRDEIRAIFGGAVEVNFHVQLSKEALDVLEAMKRERDELLARLKEFEVKFGALEETVAKGLARSATEAVKGKFDALVAEWKSTRGHHSRLDKLVLNKAYQAIIGLGQPAIPLLLREMEQRPSHWDWALKAITGADPVPREVWGELDKTAAAWVKWGKENRFEW